MAWKVGGKNMTFRISPLARRLLTELAQRQGINRTSTIELLIRAEARRQGLSFDPGEEGGEREHVPPALDAGCEAPEASEESLP
jgi:hypothetical protein